LRQKAVIWQAGKPALRRSADILVCRFADIPVGFTVPGANALWFTYGPAGWKA
jgi:hypothetical protein